MNMKNKVRASLLMVSFATLSSSALAVPAPDSRLPHVAEGPREPADALLGRWRPPSGEIVVEIARSGSGYVGTVVASSEHPALVGKALFRGLTYDSAHTVWRGQVLAVKKREYVPASIRLERDGAFVLTAGSGLFTKDIRWTSAP
jgi:uncharacterized protein (DUF2147 family)